MFILGLKPKMVLFLDGIVPGRKLKNSYDYDDTMVCWVYRNGNLPPSQDAIVTNEGLGWDSRS